MFVAIYSCALTILLAIDPPALLRRQLPAVGLAIRLHLVMNCRLLLFQVRCLVRCERTVLHAFANPLLLIALPLIHLVVRQHRARATQQQRTRHQANHYCFHVQLVPFWTLKREPPSKV